MVSLNFIQDDHIWTVQRTFHFKALKIYPAVNQIQQRDRYIVIEWEVAENYIVLGWKTLLREGTLRRR